MSNLVSEARLASGERGASAVRLVSKAPSVKPEVLSSLPVNPRPEFVMVVCCLRGYDGPSHRGGPGRGFHRASDGGVVPLRLRRMATRLRRSGDVATAGPLP